MSDLHVGGFSLKNRYKTVADAVDNARVGDVIYIHKNDSLSGVRITKSVTIVGGGHVLSVDKGRVGVFVECSGDVTIRDVKFKMQGEANALVIKSSNARLELDGATVEFDKKVDPRDWYSPIISEDDTDIRVVNCDIPHISVQANDFIVDRSTMGNVFGKRSIVDAIVFDAEGSNVSNTEIRADELDLIDCETYGSILADLRGGVGSVSNLKFKKIADRGRQFVKNFADKALIFDRQIGLRVLDGSLVVDGYVEEDVETEYTTTSIYVEESAVRVENDETFSRHVAIRSSIVATSDQEWDLTDSDMTNPNQISVGSGDSDAYQKMQNMIGLHQAKEQLERFLSTARIQAEQKRRGIDNGASYINHMVFAGPAGTGKTTVANLLAEVLVQEGVLREKKVVVAGTSDLVSKWVGETKQKTHDLIVSALGGILFIDEAYSLLPRGENNHNREAVDQIVEDATKYKDDLIIILAGYDGDMRHFIDTANTGLKSRFTQWITFEPYDFKDLVAILKYKLDGDGVIYDAGTFKHLAERFLMVYQRDAVDGGLDGNGRYVENLVRDLTAARNSRLSKSGSLSSLSDVEIRSITISDVNEVFDG